MKPTTATTARTRLVDGFGRTIEYVRLSVTDRCNLRCFYCLPRGVRRLSEPDHWLRFDEIERLMRAFAALGVQRLRLTGGEPLVRARLPELAARLSALPGIADVSLSTNATLLADYAEPLRRAGVTRLNVSLDSLKPERFHEITGGRLEPVLDGLLAARCAGFDWIKINMLALKGINDDEFTDMVEFCAAQGFTLRFIEVMPVGRPGVEASRHYLDLREVKARLAERFDLIPGVVPGWGTRALRARPRHRSPYRFHHPDVAALLRYLQPRAPLGGRHVASLPRPGPQCGAAPAASRRSERRGLAGSHPRRGARQAGAARIPRTARAGRALHGNDGWLGDL